MLIVPGKCGTGVFQTGITLTISAPGLCGRTCSGNTDEYCGGIIGLFMDLYKYSGPINHGQTIDGYTYVGCWTDGGGTNPPALQPDDLLTAPVATGMSTEYCASRCGIEGTFAGAPFNLLGTEGATQCMLPSTKYNVKMLNTHRSLWKRYQLKFNSGFPY